MRFHRDGPILVTETGNREREGHRSCVDSEVRSHSFILPFASDKTLLPEFVQCIASVNYVLQERCPFESDVILSSFLMPNDWISMYCSHCSKTVVRVPFFVLCFRLV